MDNRKQQAQRLYMEGKSQKEIAAIAGVSERTIYTWVHQFGWNKLRQAAYQAPATIADNLCSQIVEIQNVIAAREPGKRFPSADEAEVMRKLIVSLEKMKKYPSMSLNMQVLETFRNYIRPVDKDFAHSLGNYAERFLNGKSINGFVPYQLEYCVDPASPVTQFYDELEEEDPGQTKEAPCPGIDTCMHPGECSYPHCLDTVQCTKQSEAPVTENLPNNIVSPPGNRGIPAISQTQPAAPKTINTHVPDTDRSNNTNLPSPSSAPEVTGSILAIAPSENVKNIIIPLPEVTRVPGAHIKNNLGT